MADRSQMLTSPAYAALSPSGRRVLALIDSKVTHGGGVAAISFSNIERQCGMSTAPAASHCGRSGCSASSASNVDRVRAAVSTASGSAMSGVILMPPRAGGLAAQARLGKPQTPSLPRMPWDDAR